MVNRTIRNQLGILVIIFVACSSAGQKKNVFEDLNSIHLQKARYKIHEHTNDSIYYDTLQVGLDDKRYFFYSYEMQTNGRELAMYEVFERSDLEDWKVYLTYELNTDILILADTVRKRPLSRPKRYVLDDHSFEVFRFPDCIFCKNKPNVVNFISSEYGLILSLSRSKSRILKSLLDRTSDPNLNSLIDAITKDTAFYYMDLISNSF